MRRNSLSAIQFTISSNPHALHAKDLSLNELHFLWSIFLSDCVGLVFPTRSALNACHWQAAPSVVVARYDSFLRLAERKISSEKTAIYLRTAPNCTHAIRSKGILTVSDLKAELEKPGWYRHIAGIGAKTAGDIEIKMQRYISNVELPGQELMRSDKERNQNADS